MNPNPAIEKARRELKTKQFDQGFHWRILFVGRSVNGATDIVSCLSRSLRNLGHRVLDIDLAKHKGLVENPGGARGGNGPVYLSATGLQPFINEFKPQLIVCCAGGLTFNAADADALKSQGVVLVGVTLSDPDVFPTVHPHISVFDFHTTNAKHALAMYRDAGIENTLYFPFGIDRGFVTQEVGETPELAADVVCIGHATARPERNSIMSRVAEELQVRTYGRGWSLPGSEVVEGRRMVQASRSGKVHVNFPLTRAGYINIKCGVFESVGSGAVVATGRFDEMAEFFNYDSEIIGYSDPEDLILQVGDLLADPARYNRMAEAAFKRLIDNHLYEHRWMALFDEMHAVLEMAGCAWLGSDRGAEIRESLRESSGRARHVIVSGFYGASNAGDELILRSIAQRIENADPATQVWVAAENPSQVERSHGLQAFSRKSLDHALSAVRSASAVVLGGGGLWHDYTFERSGGIPGLFRYPEISIAGFAALPLMGKMFELPFHVVGLGVGPLSALDAKRMVRYVADQADSITVRDDESLRLLEECGVHASQAPDVVYALELPSGQPNLEIAALREAGYTIVGLNLRPWARCDQAALALTVADVLNELSSRSRIAVVGVPMQAGPRTDVSAIAEVFRSLKDTVPAVMLPAPLSPESLVGALKEVDLLVSMRLHACLLAHRLQKRVVGLAYDPKVRSHFEEIGRGDFCVDLPFSSAELHSSLAILLNHPDKLPAESSSIVESLERASAAALDQVAEQVAAAPSRAVVFEVPRLAESAKEKITSSASISVGAAGAPRNATSVSPRVSFTDVSYSCNSPCNPPSLGEGAKSVSVWLANTAPAAGDYMEAAGIIEVHERGDLEVSLSLAAPYHNDKATGRVRYEFEFGQKWKFVEDLAVKSAPVQFRAYLRGPIKIPFRLAVVVDRDCFPSNAWPRLSKIDLVMNGAAASEHGVRLQLTTSRGSIRRLEPSANLRG